MGFRPRLRGLIPGLGSIDSMLLNNSLSTKTKYCPWRILRILAVTRFEILVLHFSVILDPDPIVFNGRNRKVPVQIVFFNHTSPRIFGATGIDCHCTIKS